MSRRDFRQLINSVRKTERGIEPDQLWLAQNRVKLMAHAASTMPKEEFVRRSTFAILSRFIPIQSIQWMRRPVMAFLFIFSVILGGSFASVSASERSLPGDFLYSVKLATEQTRLVFTGNSSDKLKLKTEFVQRRVDEIRQVATQPGERKQERIKTAAENLKRDLQTAKQQLNDVSESSTPKIALEAAKLLDQKSSDVVQGLQEVKDSIPAESKGVVNEAENAAMNTGVKAVSVLIGSRDTPEGAEVITNDELKQSIEDKVLVLENQIIETSERLRLSAASSTASASSTTPTVSTTSTVLFASSTASMVVANTTLMEARVLLKENRLELVPVMLLEVAQVTAEADLVASNASSSAVVAEESPTGTDPGTTVPTSTPAAVPSTPTSTSTDPVLPP